MALTNPFFRSMSIVLFFISNVFTTTNARGSVSPSIGEYFQECGFYQSIDTTHESPIFTKKSKYQEIAVYVSPHYGKVLVLDGVLQLTERDASSYNEMLAHIPLFQHPKPKRVLILGGGDGYVLSEVLKHESVELVDHVDLDKDVVETCKKFFPWGKAWEDPRVKLHVADGAAFVRDSQNESYDVIIQDSSDPWTTNDDGEQIALPSSVLYAEEHFNNLQRILRPNGVLNLQAETFTIPSDLEGIVHWRKQALGGFARVRYGSLYISSYPTGQIGFLLCEKTIDEASDINDVSSRYQEMLLAGKKTSYYHPKLQTSSFDLPLWVHETIYGKENSFDSVCQHKKHDETIL